MELDMEKIQKEHEEKYNKLFETLQKRDEEIKSLGQAREETGKQVDQIFEKMKQLEEEKKELTDKYEKVEAKMNSMPYNGAGAEYKTAGALFTESDEYKTAVQRGTFLTSQINVGSLFEKAISNALVGDGTGRAPVFADRIQELIHDEAHRELRIRDLLTVIPTDSNAVTYHQETDDFKDATAKSQGGETKAKQQMKMAFEAVTVPIETIAGWLPLSRQVLADRANLQGHIDTRLRYKVELEYERQILFGSGSDGELSGIHNATGVRTAGVPSGNDTQLDHLRKAFAMVQGRDYFPNGVILHSSDWADIELLKGSDNRYVHGTVMDGAVPRVWSIPVVMSNSMEEGRFFAGDFRRGASAFEREGTTIRIAEQHSDYFVRNALAILGEMRAAVAVYRPSAFIKGVFDSDLST